jgi:PrtD family type I secretion system ABC transporter
VSTLVRGTLKNLLERASCPTGSPTLDSATPPASHVHGGAATPAALVTLLGRHRRQLAVAGLFSLVMNLLQLTVPLYMLQVFDRVLTSRSLETLVALSIGATGALLVFMLLDLLRSRLLLAVGLCVEGSVAPIALARVLDQVATQRVAVSGTELKDVATLRAFLTGPGVVALFDAPWAPLYLAVIFLFHTQLGVIATFGAVTLLALAYVNERLLRAPVRDSHAAARSAANEIDSGVRNGEVVAVLGLMPALQRRWGQRNDIAIDANVRATQRGHLTAALGKFIRLLIQVAMLAGGAVLVISEQASAGVMMTATLILARALGPVETAIGSWRALVEARLAYRRLSALLAATARQAPATPLPAPEGRLEAHGVSYAPAGADALLLKNISFSLDAGTSLGLIGPSGSGKSTLARVLTGWLRPNCGVVRLDGADVADRPREELGPHLGYLPQEAQLFDATVAENIARLGIATSDAIIDAAKRAHAHDMILQLPNGYDTVIGAGGIALSGGQRQRIALARALFGNPRLVILDEPNAALDASGEQALLAAMQDLKRAGVTLIVVSHRPSMLEQVDKLLLLNAGQVERFGPRAGIMAHVTPVAAAHRRSGPQLVVGGAQ